MDKYYQKRSILSLFLAFIILITALPTAYAEENGGETKSQVEILSPIAINEIVPDTDNHGKLDGYEFFELQNVSDTKLNLDDFIIRYNISDIWELDDKGLVLEPEDILVIWIKNTDNQDLTIDDFNNYYNTKLEQAKNLTTIQSPGFHNSKQRDLSILTKTQEVLTSARYNHDDQKKVLKNKSINFRLNSKDSFASLLGYDALPSPGQANPDQIYDSSFSFEKNPSGKIQIQAPKIAKFNASFEIEVSHDLSNLILDARLYIKGDKESNFSSYPLTFKQGKLLGSVAFQEISSYKSFDWYLVLSDGIESYKSEVKNTKVESGALDRSKIKPILITEITPDTDNIGGSDAYEFIEVTNNSDQRINFKDYQLLYNYPDNGPDSNVEWFSTDEDLFIDAFESIVFWVKNGKNDALTAADFNEYYKSNLILNKNLFEIFQGGMANGSRRGLRINSKVGTSYDYVLYNEDGLDNTHPNTSIVFMLDPEKNESYLVTDKALASPGYVTEEYLSEFASPIPATRLPSITNLSKANFENALGLTLSAEIKAYDTDLKRVNLYIKDNFSDDFSIFNLGKSSQEDIYEYNLKPVDLIGKKSYQYYFVASDGYQEISSDLFTIKSNEEEKKDLRFNLTDGHLITGQSMVTSTGENLLFDGMDVTSKTRPSLEDKAIFVFEASQTDTFFKNAVAIEDKVIGIFDDGTYSEWKTYQYEIDPSMIFADKDLVIDIHAGNKSNPLVHDQENNDDFVVKNIRLILPDGRTLSAEGYENSEKVISMGDSTGKIEILNAKFNIAKESFSALGFEFDSAQYDQGTHKFSSQLGQESLDLKLIFDNEGPEISTNIKEGKSYKNIDIEVSIKDQYSDLLAQEIRLDGEKISLPYKISSLKMPAGSHVLEVFAKDKQENNSYKKINFSIPEENPSILDLSPADESTIEGEVKFEISVSDPTGDPLTVRLKKGQSYSLGQENIDVSRGISNESGKDSDSFTAESLNGFPYEVFELEASGQVDETGKIRIDWLGHTNSHKTFLYAFNHENSSWDKLEAKKSLVGENTNFKAMVDAKNYLKDSKVKIMVQNGEGFTPDQFSPKSQALKPVFDHISTSNTNDTPRDKYDFTFAIESDTQYYNEDVETNPSIIGKYQYQLDIHDWLISNRPRINLQYLFHTGDIIDDNHIIEEWHNADKAYAMLEDAGLAYGILAGNHDVSHKDNDYTNYSKYFGQDRFANKAHYGGSYSNNRGHYDLISVEGIDFIMIYMGWDINDQEIEWMNTILKKYPERIAILNFHEYLLASGGLGEQPQRIKDEVVIPNPNVRMVLSGHYHNAKTVELALDDDGDGINDRLVQQMLFDYQGLKEGGMGYIRLMHWDNKSQTVNFRTYSPSLDDYDAKDENNINSQGIVGEENFTISYKDLGITPTKKELKTQNLTISFDSEEVIGTIEDINTSDKQIFIWNPSIDSSFGWYAEVTDSFGGMTRSDIRTLTLKNKVDQEDDTQKPDDVNKPDDTQKPDDVNKPDDTQKPDDINKPDNTQKPDDVNKPDDTQKPDDVNKPNDTQKPDDKSDASVTCQNEPCKPSADKKSPNTGDNGIGYLLLALALSGLGFVVINKLKKKSMNK